MKHTPGPWKVETDKGVGYCVYNFEGKPIATWLSRTDASLIAAAPELLAALNGFRWLGNNLHQIKQSPDEFKSLYESALEDAVKAVAKAEGK